jgi:hypothetical protein
MTWEGSGYERTLAYIPGTYSLHQNPSVTKSYWKDMLERLQVMMGSTEGFSGSPPSTGGQRCEKTYSN